MHTVMTRGNTKTYDRERERERERMRIRKRENKWYTQNYQEKLSPSILCDKSEWHIDYRDTAYLKNMLQPLYTGIHWTILENPFPFTQNISVLSKSRILRRDLGIYKNCIRLMY